MHSLRKWPQPFYIAGFSFAAFSVTAVANPKIKGLEFPIGQPWDRPIAKVSIAELGQSAQKKGFFRIALLPITSAKGVEIRFFIPSPAVLLEVPDMIRSLSAVEAQEFYSVTLLTSNEASPRLYAEDVTPKKDHWRLKRVKWTASGAQGEASECQLLLHGPDCGKFVVPDSVPPIPSLQELLQTGPAR